MWWRYAFAVTVFVTLGILFVGSAFFVVRSATFGETNLDILSDTIFPCEPFAIHVGERNVVLRIDDVQAYAWSGVTTRIINDAHEREIPLVLGVIPKNLKQDSELYSYLRKRKCNLEFALHGWDHDTGDNGVTPEFRDKPYKEAKDEIERGREVIETLSREDLVTWIPPNNDQSEGTTQAVAELEIPITSKEGSGYYDFHAATFDYDIDELVSADTVVADCEVQFERSDLCVVMMHPQDFVDFPEGNFNETKYQVYLNVLEGLAQRDVSFVRFKDLAR